MIAPNIAWSAASGLSAAALIEFAIAKDLEASADDGLPAISAGQSPIIYNGMKARRRLTPITARELPLNPASMIVPQANIPVPAAHTGICCPEILQIRPC
jgi:hypothetical protein